MLGSRKIFFFKYVSRSLCRFHGFVWAIKRPFLLCNVLWLILQGLEWSNEAGKVVLESVARQNREESLNITCSSCCLQRNISASDATAEPENHGGHQIPTRGRAVCEQSARAEGRAGEWNAAPRAVTERVFPTRTVQWLTAEVPSVGTAEWCGCTSVWYIGG